MKTHLLLVGLTAGAVVACNSSPEVRSAWDDYRRASLAEAGSGAEVLAVCGPFQPAGETEIPLPAEGKFIAFIDRADDSLFIRQPFVIPANPPVTPDPSIVAVDQQGRPLPGSPTAQNTIVRERTTTPWSSSFTAQVWRVDAQGAPLGEDREVYAVSKSWFGNRATASVSIAGRTSEFTADCG